MSEQPSKTYTLTANIEIDPDDNDLFGLRDLNKRLHPLSENRLLDLVRLGALPPAAIGGGGGVFVTNKANGCQAKLVIRYGRYSAKIPRKLKKRLMPLSVRESLGYGWKDFCRLQFMAMVDHYVSAKIDADMESMLEQMMQAEDKNFLSLCERAAAGALIS